MDKYSFDTKYKERKPLETVKIIQDFFKSKNLTTEYFTEERTESLSWFAKIKLYYKNIVILSTNGKGMTEELCLASGFGELYERYCNRTMIFGNSFMGNAIAEEHYKNYGYYFHPQEKIISADELFANENHILSYYGDKNFIKDYFNMIYHPLIGFPYKNILNNTDILYLDHRVIPLFRSSTGMASGNTYKEAFNQGFSEILEHYWSGLYLTDPFDKYYQIDLNNITNTVLQKSIKNILKANNDLYIYDLSYNIDFPVLMGVLVCKKTNKIIVDISAFPIFDIALERVITELYQGTSCMRDYRYDLKQLPYRNYSIEYLEGVSPTCITGKQGYPEQIFFKTKIVDTYSNCFLTQQNITNEEIFNYYINLIKKHDLKTYVLNVSQSDQMTALHIYVKNLTSLEFCKMIKLSKNYNKYYNFIIKYYNFFNKIINYNEYDFNLLKFLSNEWINFSSFDENFIYSLIYTDHFCPYHKARQNGLVISYLLQNINDTKTQQQIMTCAHEFDYEKISKYLLLYSYVEKNNYTYEEIKKIMEEIYKLHFTEEEYSNILDPAYLIYKIFIEKLYNSYHNDNEYIKILANFNTEEK